jgi:hypothetical protein
MENLLAKERSGTGLKTRVVTKPFFVASCVYFSMVPPISARASRVLAVDPKYFMRDRPRVGSNESFRYFKKSLSVPKYEYTDFVQSCQGYFGDLSAFLP